MSAIQEEIWKSIPNNSHNEVSNTGLVRNIRTKQYLTFNKLKDSTVNCYIILDSTKKKIRCKIEYLVASAFIPNPDNKLFIKHLNEIKDDNNIVNLKWIDDDEMKIIKNNEKLKLKKYFEELRKNEEIDILNKNQEIWKQIPGCSNYQASSLGKIRNLKTKKELSLQIDEKGYIACGLYIDKDYKHISRRVHQLVALTFIPNPENKPTVNHINNDKHDNLVTNLEWATMKEQNSPSKKNTNKGIKNNRKKRQVWKYDLKENKLEKFNSVIEASLDINVAITTIKASINLKKPTHGFIYKYETFENLPDEIWKLINPKFINDSKDYEVSNKGRIKNKYGYLHELQAFYTGYIMVSIGKSDYRVHRLVAQTFLDNPNNLPVVNHIDGQKDNNFLENLEWNTNIENSNHAIESGLKLTQKKIFQYDINGKFINEFINCVKAAEQFANSKRASIAQCARKNINKNLNDKYGTMYKFIWIYATNNNEIPKNLIFETIQKINNSIKINKIDNNNIIIKTYDSISEAGLDNNINHKTLSYYINKNKIKNGYFYKTII